MLFVNKNYNLFDPFAELKKKTLNLYICRIKKEFIYKLSCRI